LYIESLHLGDFRNFENADFHFSRGTNLILGKNGAGKSNVIEALYMLSTSKSFRKTADRKILRWGADGYRLKGEFWTEHGGKQIELRFSDEGKLLSIDGVGEKRISAIIGHVYCVLYFFEDVYLVSGPPHLRRSFIDLVLSTVDPLYLDSLQRYINVLRQKNRYLFENVRVDANLLSAWNDQLVEYGSSILQKRLQLIEFLNETIDRNIDSSGASGAIGDRCRANGLVFPYRLRYRASVRFPDIDYGGRGAESGKPAGGEGLGGDSPSALGGVERAADAFRRTLDEGSAREITARKALFGPHRDDFSFSDGTVDVRHFASIGEARLASIVLKLAQALFYKEKRGVLPILLFDDIFLELDAKNMERVIALIGEDSQRIITTTEREKLPEIFHCDRVFTIGEKGKVEWVNHDASIR
jgi:DNA replication and repair protein RecF